MRVLVTTFATAVLAAIGMVGLAIDISFHWASACYVHHQCNLAGTLLDLLVDVDPTVVPHWLTAMGVFAHTLFIGGFSLLVIIALANYRTSRRWR